MKNIFLIILVLMLCSAGLALASSPPSGVAVQDVGVPPTDTVNATAPLPPLPPYDTLVVAKKPGDFIGIYCTLAEPVDKATLESLGRDCFGLATGTAYKQVLINWYLVGMPKQGKPWGVTNFAMDQAQVEIFGVPQ